MPYKRLERARKKVRNLKSKRRVKKRSKELQKERDRRKRKERIEGNNPEGVREKAAATAHQSKKLAGEFGVTSEKAERFSSGVNRRLRSAAEKAKESIPEEPSEGGSQGQDTGGFGFGFGSGPQGGKGGDESPPMLPGFGPMGPEGDSDTGEGDAQGGGPMLPGFGMGDVGGGGGGGPQLPDFGGWGDSEGDEDDRDPYPWM